MALGSTPYKPISYPIIREPSTKPNPTHVFFAVEVCRRDVHGFRPISYLRGILRSFGAVSTPVPDSVDLRRYREEP